MEGLLIGGEEGAEVKKRWEAVEEARLQYRQGKEKFCLLASVQHRLCAWAISSKMVKQKTPVQGWMERRRM